MVAERFGPLTPDPGSVFDATPRSHYGIHAQKQQELNYAGLHVPVGRLKAEDFQDLASLSEGYGSGEVRLTEDQNVIITGIPSGQLDRFKSEPLLQKFPLEPSHLAAGTVSCTGNTYCSFALTNTKDQALQQLLSWIKSCNCPTRSRSIGRAAPTPAVRPTWAPLASPAPKPAANRGWLRDMTSPLAGHKVLILRLVKCTAKGFPPPRYVQPSKKS